MAPLFVWCSKTEETLSLLRLYEEGIIVSLGETFWWLHLKSINNYQI